MSLLRLYCPLGETPSQCDWAWIEEGKSSRQGRSRLKDLPARAGRVQLVVPATDTLLAHVRLPAIARRATGTALAFAVEELTVTDPDVNQVSWLGSTGEFDTLAVIDKNGLERWRKALGDVGIHRYEVQSELLLLPQVGGLWSLVWNGQDGFIRTGRLEGATTDAGDARTPPMVIRLMLEQAIGKGRGPAGIAVHPVADATQPDPGAWGASLGVPVRIAAPSSWRDAPSNAGIPLFQESRRWESLGAVAPQIRVAGWIAVVALGLHGLALVVDWTILAGEQRHLRQRMETRFREVFPETTAVVDPVLQMRRKLAEARHAAGKPDAGDFLPMLGRLGAELRELPPGALRVLSYENGRMTLEIMTVDERTVGRLVARLRQAGLTIDNSSSAGRSTLTVRTR